MKKLALLGIIIGLVFCSCTVKTDTELTAEQKATIEKEIQIELEKYASAINQLNFESWAECYSKNNFISVSKFKTGCLTDYDEWMNWVKISMSERERHQTEQVDQKITPLTTDLVLVTKIDIWENWWKNGDYRKTNGITTLLYKKEQESWKIIHITETGETIEETLGNQADLV